MIQNLKFKVQDSTNNTERTTLNPELKTDRAMKIFPNISLAILSGGKALRMGGRNKALIEISGQTFIQRIFNNLSPLFGESIIISNSKDDFGILRTPVYQDIMQNIGPLGGIHSALINSSKSYVFVLSCDMPFADASIAANLAEEFLKTNPDILVPTVNKYKEPLFAIYSKSLIPTIESIEVEIKGRPITDLLKISNTVYFDLPDNDATQKCFTNINSLDDLKTLV